jgi:hypothetical protein
MISAPPSSSIRTRAAFTSANCSARDQDRKKHSLPESDSNEELFEDEIRIDANVGSAHRT